MKKTDSDGFLKAREKGVGDEFLIHRELYNPNDFDILIERDRNRVSHIVNSRIPLGPERAVLKARDWIYLPHGYFIFTASNGAPVFDVITNFGDAIGKGIKNPSRPEVKLR